MVVSTYGLYKLYMCYYLEYRYWAHSGEWYAISSVCTTGRRRCVHDRPEDVCTRPAGGRVYTTGRRTCVHDRPEGGRVYMTGQREDVCT